MFKIALYGFAVAICAAALNPAHAGNPVPIGPMRAQVINPPVQINFPPDGCVNITIPAGMQMEFPASPDTVVTIPDGRPPVQLGEGDGLVVSFPSGGTVTIPRAPTTSGHGRRTIAVSGAGIRAQTKRPAGRPN